MTQPDWLDVDFSGLWAFLETLRGALLELSTATMVAYVLLALLVIWGISLFKKYLRMRGERPLDPAKAAEAAQDPLQAGELFERARAYHQAIEAYKAARAFQEVGRVYELLREWDDAAQFYSISGNTEKAAIMYQKEGNYLQSAECYLRCGKNLLAAEMFEKAQKYESAARQYEKFGKSLKAAELYKQSGNNEKAAQKYERYFLKQSIVASNLSAEKRQKINQAALEGGLLYMKLKQPLKAMEIFAAAGLAERAAEAAIHAGEIEKAAHFYLSSRAFEKAAELFRSMGDRKQAHWIMAKKHQEEKHFLAAGKAFEAGEGWIEAGEMYEKGGDARAAGEMYQKAGDYHHAADLFMSSGDLSSAADALENGGRLEEASELYVQLARFGRAAEMQELLGNYYEAALFFKEQGDLEQCIVSLQRVGLESAKHVPAMLLLGKLLAERGRIPAAKDCFQKVVSEKSVAPETIEIYYRLAVLHEVGKSFEEAERLYEEISKLDPNYKDVRPRSALLKKALSEVKKALAAPRKSEEIRRDEPVQEKQADHPPKASRYKRLHKIGQGGMGVVYLAEDTVLRRRVAYKVLPPSIRENPSVLQSFMQEARIAAALNHPNIVTVFDTGRDGEDLYITMEYVDGLSLKQYLERHQTSLDDRIMIMKSICQGVAYAHGRRVVHRDLKPTNVMLLRDRTVKIMDFGLARHLTDTMTEKTSVKGTPLYMSPEQIVGEKVDKLSDIYALGCTFYRMLTGRPPFSKGDVYYQHLHAKAKPLRSVNPEIPLALERIVLKCIEKRKERRFQSVEEILSALAGLPKDPLTDSHANPDVDKQSA